MGATGLTPLNDLTFLTFWRSQTHTARRCVTRYLRVQIGIDEDEMIRRRRPDQLRAASRLAHPDHLQFEQRSRP
jgi:hypothetical protein